MNRYPFPADVLRILFLLFAGCSAPCFVLGQRPVAVQNVESDDRAASQSVREIAEQTQQLRVFLQANPQSEERFRYGYLLMREGKAQASLEQYTLAARVRRPSADDLKNVALDYALLKSYPDATRWIERAIEEDNRSPELWYVRGRISYEQLHYAEAAASFERALQLAPRSAKIENNLGLAYEGLGRTEDARIAYEEAIALQADANPRSEQPYLNLGILTMHQGDMARAESLLEKANQIAAKDPRSHKELGDVYLKTGRLAEAQAQLEVAVKLSPDDPALHFLLGRIYRANGRGAEASTEFQRSAELNRVRSAGESTAH